MKNTFVKAAVFSLVGSLALSSGAMAQEAKSLDELLDFVKQGSAVEQKENKAREAAFRNAKSRQAELLAEAKALRAREEARSTQLEKDFEQNDLRVAEKEGLLKERKGALTELFGHITSAAGDLESGLETSLVSAQYPNRGQFMRDLIAKTSSAERLPSIAEIERLWFEMQREMTESGKVVSFEAEVSLPGGEKETRRVVRIGTYNIVTDEGNYLNLNERGVLEELARQPSGQYRGWAADLANLTSGYTTFGVDPTGPSGGTLLAALIDSPTFMERFHQGGSIGYAITALGAFALVLALWRLLVLTAMSGKVKSQMASKKANANNPLGRVLLVHEQNPTMDTETLELKLSEAVLREVPQIEFGLNLLKIIAAVGPLMGLLGTVTGMIVTFQAITIFGAGDPQAMAGGISAALITTVQGLLVAIPVVLLHTLTSSQAKKIIHVLNEQATGLIAQHTEAQLGNA